MLKLFFVGGGESVLKSEARSISFWFSLQLPGLSKY